MRLLTDQEKRGAVRYKETVGVEDLTNVCVSVLGDVFALGTVLNLKKHYYHLCSLVGILQTSERQ